MVQGPLHGHHRRPCGPRETHNYKTLKSFTQKYIITNPVHVEEFDGPKSAIAREKQIKGWTRDKKVALIESMNPDWEDLSQNWFSHGVVSPPPDSSVPQNDVKDELALNATLEAAK